MNKRYSALLIFVFFGVHCFGQIRSSITKKANDFDYNELILELNNASDLTADELSLAAEIHYKIRNFDKSQKLLDSVKSLMPLTPELMSLERDLKENRSRQLTISPTINASFFWGSKYEDKFVSHIEKEHMYISSSTQRTGAFRIRDIRNDQSFLSLYKTKRTLDTLTVSNKILSEKAVNFGPISAFMDGYCVTRNYPKSKEKRNLKLIFTDKDFNTTSEFPYNDLAYSIGHATFDSVRSQLIFASDMPLGDGRTDLWSSRWENNQWATPVKMSEVNSAGNEMFPVVYGDILYFSSNGREGFGGLDIFSVDLSASNAVIEHLPSPINSRADDFGFFWTEENREAFLNSNRSTNEKDAVYKIVFKDGNATCNSVCVNENCLRFYVDGFEDLEEGRFEFEWDFGDGTREKGAVLSHCYSTIGKYVTRLSVKDLATGTVEENVMNEEVEIVGTKGNYPAFSVPNVLVGEVISVVDEGQFTDGEPSETRWESSDGQISNEKVPAFRFTEPGYYRIKRLIKYQNEACCSNSYETYVRVLGDIKEDLSSDPFDLSLDLDGSDLYPVQVVFLNTGGKPVTVTIEEIDGDLTSENQVQESTHLILDHHKKYLLTAVSASGNTVQQVLSSDAKHEREFSYYELEFPNPGESTLVIVQDEDGNPLPNSLIKGNVVEYYADSNGKSFVSTKDDTQFNVSQKGYWPNSCSVQGKKDSVIVVLSKMSVGKSFKLENIRFDLSKHAIRPDAAVILDDVAKTLLENPSIHIELGAHTDARGSDPSNMLLSERRAKSSMEYLISKGISAKRITYQGYGETKLLNHCANGVRCSEPEHERNRRVEITISKM